MQAAVLHSLEFDRIREALASRTATPLGRARALVLDPATERETVREALALTVEAVRFSRDGGSLGLSAPEGLDSSLGQLDIQDQPLDPPALLGLARFLRSIETVTMSARRTGGPRLATLAARAVSFAEETAAIERAIEPSGEVSDRASAALKEIRDSLRRQRAKLRSSLDSMSRDRDTAKYLRDQIVTDRNGRYVLVVRAEHRDAIPGIVHGSSTSGASLYLEPLATVGLNNDIVALAEKERAEVHRILTALTNAFRERADELETTLDVAAELDELYAKVDLATRMDGVAPEITEDGSLELVAARHPLLIPAVRDLVDPADSAGAAAERRTAGGPVASTLSLVAPTRALVISGPNTGGKTVALKAFGLLPLMAQSGLLIPAEAGSRFTPFRTIFADIGDEQSISASLSTFSAHMANIVAMERAFERPALVLLDEVGGGTDPIEGGALGAAIVDHFRRRGALVVATTHDDTLKSYAATTDGVATGGFGFNPETYAPTYRLIYGAPGRSLALEIAERLGLPHDVIADARGRTSGRESLLSEHLSKLDRQFAAVEHEREQLAAERAALAGERQRLLERESKLTEREAVLRRRLDDRLNEKLREARAEVDQIVGTLKRRADALAEQAEKSATGRAQAVTTGQMGDLKRDARVALDSVAGVLGDAQETGGEEPLSEPPDPGDRVFVPAFQAEGVVRSVSGKHVEVDVRGMRTRVAVRDLRRPPVHEGRHELRTRGASDSRAAGRVRVSAAPRDAAAARELVVVGSTVDQAIDRAEKFLDDALLADERRLRVVHGHGTGKLRDALTRFFQAHPLVASVSPAGEREGGGAATIVELKE
jgi:DNA mismatch repair protein MutS2